MTIGLMVMAMTIEGSTSLKDKRMVIQSVRDRVAHRFNVSLIESGCQNHRRDAELAFALLASSRRHAEQQLDQIEGFIIETYPGRHACVQRDYFEGLEK